MFYTTMSCAREVPSHAGIMRGESGFTDTAQEPRPIPLNWCWWNGLSPSLATARSRTAEGLPTGRAILKTASRSGTQISRAPRRGRRLVCRHGVGSSWRWTRAGAGGVSRQHLRAHGAQLDGPRQHRGAQRQLRQVLRRRVRADQLGRGGDRTNRRGHERGAPHPSPPRSRPRARTLALVLEVSDVDVSPPSRV